MKFYFTHVRLFRGAVGDKFVFMDDNATCHRTLAVQDCPDSEGIQRLVWPARSPDLNPIENVWDALGEASLLVNLSSDKQANTLIRALTEEWDKLPQQLLDSVVQKLNDEKNRMAQNARWTGFERRMTRIVECGGSQTEVSQILHNVGWVLRPPPFETRFVTAKRYRDEVFEPYVRLFRGLGPRRFLPVVGTCGSQALGPENLCLRNAWGAGWYVTPLSEIPDVHASSSSGTWVLCRINGNSFQPNPKRDARRDANKRTFKYRILETDSSWAMLHATYYELWFYGIDKQRLYYAVRNIFPIQTISSLG
ncbi:transposable element Tc3 transposase [Trichonephila clavipes]|nr:transposable element Tc3 transposase [Trichonephila clavipes]